MSQKRRQLLAARVAARKAAATSGIVVAPTGPGGLLSTPGLTRPGKRTKAPGDKVPVVGNLCRVGGQFAPCDAEAEAEGEQAGGGGAAPRTTMPVPDDPAQVEANVNAVFDQVELSEDAYYSLVDAAANGGAIDGEDELYAAGLAEPGPDGAPQLTDKGRALAEAAQAGDAETAKQIMAGQGAAPAAETPPAAEPARPAPSASLTPAASPRRDLRAMLAQALSGARPRAALASVGKAAMKPSRKRAYWKAYHAAKAEGLDPAAARAQARLTLRGQDKDKAWRGYEKAIARMGKAQGDFAVFKDARGQYRWLARSTTAFKDRDQEILAVEALDRDSQRMTRTTQYGPLRYWHAGQPELGTPEQPWGPGVDLGMCDSSIVIGRTRYESGTFADPEVGAAIAETAEQYELSPGFYHPYGPGGPPDGVYREIQTFERSLVPVARARASNLFTGLTVKEYQMNEQELERRIKAFVADMRARGVDPQMTLAVLGQGQTAEKAADARGIAYKSEPAPDAPQEIVIGGVTYTVKAPMPGGEMMQAGATELVDGMARAAEPPAEGDEPEDEGERLLSDMEVDLIAERVSQKLLTALDAVQQKMMALDEQMKGYGYARKEQADLTRRVDQLGAELGAFTKAIKEFTDDLPATGYRPSQAGADEQSLAQAQAALKGGDAPLDPIAQIAATLPSNFGGGIPWPFDVAPPAGVNTTQHAAPGARP